MSWHIDMPIGPSVVRPFWARFPWYLPALIAIGLGLALLQSQAMFAGSPNWRVMASTFGQHSETIWGALFLSVGTAHVIAKRFNLRVRWATAFTLVAMFTFLAASLTWSAGVLSTGTIAYGGYAALAIWAVVWPR